MLKTIYKPLSTLLAVMLLFSIVSADTVILGPGLSAGALGPITATDLLEEEIVFPSNVLAATASTTKYTNIMLLVTSAVSNLGTVTFTVENDANTTMVYSDTSLCPSYVGVREMADNKIQVTYSPYGDDATDTEIIRCAYNSTASSTSALASVTVTVTDGFLEDYSSFSQTPITVVKAQLGDINGDGSVSADDAQKALQVTSGNFVPNVTQALAGDVNFDGAVNSADALKISQYSVDKLYSFLPTDSVVSVSTPSTDPIVANTIYKTKNVATEEYLVSYPNSTATGTNQYVGGTENFSTNFTMSYSGGMCTFKRKIDNKYLGCDASGNLLYLTSPSGLSYFWYVTPTTGGYYLVNYAHPEYLLDKTGDLGRNIDSAVWNFEAFGIILKYNYNFGYRYRYWKSHSSIDLTDAALDRAISSELETTQGQIATILQSVFGVSVTTETPKSFMAWEDMCYSPSNPATVAGLISAIGDNEIMDETADGNPDDGDICDCATSPQCFARTTVHHRNASEGLDYYYNYKDDTTYQKIWLLVSGYEPCSNIDTNEDGIDDSHAYGRIGGLAKVGKRTAGVYHADSGNDNKNTIAALHEISHCLGAVEENGCLADKIHAVNDTVGDEIAEEEDGLAMCVMSYNRDDDALMQYYNSLDPASYRSLYCDLCYNTIVNHLKYY